VSEGNGGEHVQRVRIAGLATELQLPEGQPPFPAVIVLHEVFGLNGDMRRIGRRFVDNGYAVLAPDLYSDGPRPLCVARTLADLLRDAGRVTAGKIGALREWLTTNVDIDAQRIGVAGFCMGGGFALAAGASSAFAVSGVNYGQLPTVPDVTGSCPVIASYGDADRATRGQPEALEEALSAAGIPHDVKVYPGVGHSFMNRSLPEFVTRRVPDGYDEEAAEDAWQRMLAFFAERLRPA
jgi:carboxymethylenebutenolidase